MAELLELAHLPQDHRVPQVQVGPRGVGSELDREGPPLLELGEKLFLGDDLLGPPLEEGQGLFRGVAGARHVPKYT